jgi:hypothetical protein
MTELWLAMPQKLIWQWFMSTRVRVHMAILHTGAIKVVKGGSELSSQSLIIPQAEWGLIGDDNIH